MRLCTGCHVFKCGTMSRGHCSCTSADWPAGEEWPIWTVTGHPSGAHMCPGTLPVPICTRVPFWCPCVPGHPLRAQYVSVHHSNVNLSPCAVSRVQMIPGTLTVPICVRAPFLVPICARAPLWYPSVSRHHSGAHVCLGTLQVPIRAQEHFWCLYVPGHPFGVDIWSVTHMLPDTYSNVNLRPCTVSSVHMSPGTLQVPIFVRAPFQYPYVPWHHSGTQTCLSTLLVPICTRAPLRCPYLPGHPTSDDICPGILPVAI